MGKVYDWAVNPYKEARAIKDAKDLNAGKKPSEEQVRALYERYGGLVREKDGASNVMGTPEDVAEIVIDKSPVKVKEIASDESSEDSDDAPRRRGRATSPDAE